MKLKADNSFKKIKMKSWTKFTFILIEIRIYATLPNNPKIFIQIQILLLFSLP
jgi:hypothetical protein